MCEHTKVSNKINLLPHNQELYGKIVEQIEKGEKSIFYSQATGLGKSFIFMKLVEDYFQGKRIMYIVPKIAIWKNLIRHKEFQALNAMVEMFTYQAFNTYDTDLVKRYDVVFIDECHHMLSDIQGINIMTYCLDMNSAGKFTFGFTATPYYQGKYVDEECFDVSCYGYDVYEAIDNKLLPKIKLALASIDLDEVPWDLKVQYSITGTKNLLHKLIEEHSEVHRWLAYFSNSKELELGAQELSILFPGFKILKTYVGYELDDFVIDEFNEYEGDVILLSVNKLLEGVHLKNVQGVLLYRNVVEFSTYMQMYGRLCDINAKMTPLFLDVSNAILSLKGLSETKSARFTGERKVYKRKDLFDITASDYWTIELADMLSSILYHKTSEFADKVVSLYKEGKKLQQVCEELKISKKVVYTVLRKHAPEFITDNKYSPDEISIIRAAMEEGLSCDEIVDRVNKYHEENNTGLVRTPVGIKQIMTKRLKITKRQLKPMKDHEIQILKLHGEDKSIEELMELLPGRSYGVIYGRLVSMGIKYRKAVPNVFEDVGEDKLRELHKRYLRGAKLGILAKEVGISNTSLERAWRMFGLVTKLNYNQIFSLPDNYEILKSCWAKPERKEILAKEFPEVALGTFPLIAANLGLTGIRKPMSDEEVRIIRDCIIKHISVKDTCDILNNLEENKSIGLIRKPDHLKVVRIKIRQNMIIEGFSDMQLSDKYTEEEDAIVQRCRLGEISLEEATALINDLQFNKDRYLTRTVSSVATRKRDMIKNRSRT